MAESAPNRPAGSASGVKASTIVVGAIIALVAIVGFTVGTWLLIRSTTPTRPGAGQAGTEPYASAWASAMKKAGVDASLPPEPVDLTTLKAQGTHPFDATFTAEEATALLNIYTFVYQSGDQVAQLQRPRIRFPEPGVMRISANVTSGGQSADVQIEGPVTYSSSTKLKTPGATSVTAEGFPVGGAQGKQATQLAVQYADAYLEAAPGLSVVKATIEGDGIHVRGQAPNTLTFK